MRAAVVGWVLTAMAATAGATQPADLPIVEIRVHGNHATPDAEVLTVSGLKVGDAASDPNLDAARTRLEASGRFASVAVRRLARSIDDPSDIMVMLLVEEVAGASQDLPRPGWLRQVAAGLMWQPVLRYDEGYGFTYGVQPALADLFGPDSRVMVPLTWGGERRAGLELHRGFAGPVVSRVAATGDVRRTEHPAFDVIEQRTGVRARAERSLGSSLRVGAAAGHDRVRFGDDRGEVTSYGRLARAIGRVGAARAVGGAVGRNPIGLAIPCHRVIAGDGSIGGYGGDWFGSREQLVEIKRELLAMEGVELPVPLAG